MTSRLNYEVPDELVQAIREGRCVAFVGAGFMQPTLPSWHQLLEKLAKKITDATRRSEVEGWLRSKFLTSRDYEGLAECIEDALAPSLHASLYEILSVPLQDQTRRRRKILDEVPFRAVLTTNFDEHIPGMLPCSSTYASVLTAPRRAWWDGYYWQDGGSMDPLYVKLHGKVGVDCAESLVFTTRSYRKLVHESPGYRAFLRALFATHAVLYMGFSFTDQYINDLRSETLAMLGLSASDSRGQDFAILDDVPEVVARHFKCHEGLVALDFSTHGKTNFEGFDRWLEAIYAKASPEATLRCTVSGKKILWFDPSPDNNRHGFEVLRATADLTPVESLEQALEELGKGNRGIRASDHELRYDLVVSHFGWKEGALSNCERLLTAMRSEDIRAPVIVFASSHERARNRSVALELGALAYTHGWEELFQTIEAFFCDSGNQA